MNNQTNETLQKINAKKTLGLPLTDSEVAFSTLYGNTGAAPADGDTEWQQKREFVRKYLSPLLAAANINVARAEYARNLATREEVVTITYKNGYAKQKCVTADSLLAIVQDVTKGL